MNRTLHATAVSRLRHNRSTTLLSMIAMILTATLLMGLGTGAYGMVRITQEMMAEGDGNQHAQLVGVGREQVEILARHVDVESLYVREDVASLDQDRIKCSLMVEEHIKEGIRLPGIAQGRQPVAEDEIACPPLFLDRLGVPRELGQRFTLSFRLQGEGETMEQEFVVVGILEEQDIPVEDLSDARIVYSAFISPALADSWLGDGERHHYAYYRVEGEDNLNFAQMEEKIFAVAEDAGVHSELVNVNGSYLIWMVDLDPDLLTGVVGAALLIVGFCALVIYSIYYVSVITSIQELGKIRALGATKRQMKGLVLREGLYTAAVSIPIGLVLGYVLGRFGSGYVSGSLGGDGTVNVNMLHPLIVLAVIAVVVGTVLLSLLRPMGIVSRISPMEAIRYQEKAVGSKASRKGYDTVNITRLSTANLSRNRKRSTVTIVALAAGCVLFMTVSGVIGGMSALNYARRVVPKGDMYLGLDYSVNERTYTDRNLDQLQLAGVMDTAMVAEIEALPGVTAVERAYRVLADVEHPAYDGQERCTVGAVNREDFERMAADHWFGTWDYDYLLEQGGIIDTYPSLMDYYGVEIGDEMPLVLFSGEDRVGFDSKVLAGAAVPGADSYLMPAELFHELVDTVDTTSGIFIHTEEDAYESVKAEVRERMMESEYLEALYLDEEVRIAAYSNRTIMVVSYCFLGVLGVVSMMNLINTMITSVVTRRRELGLLQAVGLSGRQLTAMLQREGMVFTGSALVAGLTVGNLLGYLAYRWAKSQGMSAVGAYQYPLAQTLVMIAALVAGQVLITFFISRYVQRDTVIERIKL